MPHDPNEIIALVNEKDRKIGRIKREGVHSSSKLHREAYLLIRNLEDKILVQKRTDSHKLDYSAAGHFSYNETYIQGAIREAWEEIGVRITASKMKKIAKYRLDISEGEHHIKRFVTLFEVVGDYKISDFRIDEGEVASIRFYSIPKLKQMLKNKSERLGWGFARSLKIYLNKTGL